MIRTSMSALVLAVACIGPATPGLAAVAFQGVDCVHPEDQASLNICAGECFKAADDRLNAAYHTLFAKISPAGRTQLQAAQRAWLAYRDAQCAFETVATVGGSIHPMIVSGCRESVTLDQVKRLNAQIHCEEGDLSCGGQ